MDGRRLTSWALHGGVLAGAAVSLAVDRRLRRSGRNPAVAVPAVTAVFYGVVALTERVRPHRKDWQPTLKEFVTDGTFLASVMATQGAAMAVAAPVRRRTRRTFRADRLPVPVGAAVGILAFDLFHSRMHQVSHQWGPAWRVHSVHHSAERLYWFNATRFQTLEMFVDMVVETVVVGTLGLSHEQHVVYQALRSMYGQVQHCNVDVDSGPLNRVFSTPDLHRWHHSTVYAEGDTNFGAVTSVWDQLLGTHFDPEDRDGPEQTGVGRMPDFPQSFWELERVPLDWAQIRERNSGTWSAEEPATA
jgi:sterol desaturase/sphingolipid hydroxylase (fatty acid hydroxylase superfamily)